MNKIINIVILTGIIFLLGMFSYEIVKVKNDGKMGSTVVGNDYQYKTSTSTPPTNLFLKGSAGSLARATIVDAGIAGGSSTLIDGTTTTGVLNKTITIIPSDIAAGTYDFDLEFNYGLIWQTSSGTLIGTTSIMFR